MKDKLYKIAPLFIQNLMISLFNYLAYKKDTEGIINCINKHSKQMQN